MSTTLFLTYNPGSAVEESTALRLQTIASLYGLRVELPDRVSPSGKHSTDERIQRADFVIAFPLQATLSEVLMRELDNALHAGKTLILIYDNQTRDRIQVDEAFRSRVFETTIEYNTGQMDDVLHKVAQFVQNRHTDQTATQTPAPHQTQQTHQAPVPKSVLNNTEKGLLAFLGVGLGVLGLAMLLNRDE